jgi:putative tricarboxylic transport membrane protein
VTLRHPDLIGAVAIMLVAAAVIGGALTSPDPGFGVVRPATLPVIIGVLMLVSATWLASANLRGAAQPVPQDLDRGPLAATAAALAAFLAAFVPVGFVLSATLYLAVQARILGSRQPVRDAIAALIFAVAIYLLFVRFLTIDLPNGPLPF